MTRSRLSLVPAIAATLLVLVLASPLSAQAPPPTGAARARAASPAVTRQSSPQSIRTVTEAQDANETRRQFEETLGRYSPNLASVLKLDPTLLANADYLAPYPTLAEFLARHPEVARDPGFFLEQVSIAGQSRPQETGERLWFNLWRDSMQDFSIFLVFTIVTSALVWLIKTLIDYKRWSRLARVQADVHNKMVDRFANNDELLAYAQTPAGRRFLESAPIALDPATGLASPSLRRILFAMEAGFVLVAGGIGLQYVSRHVPSQVSPAPLVLGVLGVALGIGFVVAAIVSYLISKHLGLLPAPTTPDKGLSS